MRHSIMKKETNLSPAIELNPDLVKKLNDLTHKIDKMERIQYKGASASYYDSFHQRVSKSRDNNFRGSSEGKTMSKNGLQSHVSKLNSKNIVSSNQCPSPQ